MKNIIKKCEHLFLAIFVLNMTFSLIYQANELVKCQSIGELEFCCREFFEKKIALSIFFQLSVHMNVCPYEGKGKDIRLSL